MWEHDRCFWLISTAFDFRVPTKHCVTGFQAVGIETGQILGQLILKSSHYTHFQIFFPKVKLWRGILFTGLNHRNPWLWGEICGSSERRRCSLCGLPIEELRFCRWKSQVFLDFWSGTLGFFSEAFAEAIWYERMTGSVLCLASYDKNSSMNFHLGLSACPIPKMLNHQNDVFQVIFLENHMILGESV